MIMVASKIDVANKEKLAKLKRYCKKKESGTVSDLRSDRKRHRRIEVRHGG